MRVRDPSASDPDGDSRLNDLLKRIPTQLFRYSGLAEPRFGWMRDLVVDSKLFFASPSSFNDPFDCRVPLLYDASTLAIESYWRRVAKRKYPNVKMRQHKPLIRRMVLDSKTPQGQDRLTRDRFRSLEQHGTACFAKDPASMLLWSYYGDGHAGIAVRFNMSLENLGQIPPGPIPIEVKYRTTFPSVNFYEGSTSDLIMTILGTKSIDWKHEDEWRLVLVKKCGYVRIPPSMIDGVILGMRIDSKNEATVRSWVAQRSPPLEVLRVVKRPGTFELTLAPA